VSAASKTNTEQHQQEPQEPYSNFGRQELLWNLFDRVLDALTDAVKRAEETGKPLKAPMLAIILMFLKHNNIKVERSSRGLSKGLSAISNALDPFKTK